jgi:hypothetical protein
MHATAGKKTSRKLITVGPLRDYVALIYPADGPILLPRLVSLPPPWLEYPLRMIPERRRQGGIGR